MRDLATRILHRIEELERKSSLPPGIRQSAVATVIAEELKRHQDETLVAIREMTKIALEGCKCWSTHECEPCRNLRMYTWPSGSERE
jgi:hypothetical protein